MMDRETMPAKNGLAEKAVQHQATCAAGSSKFVAHNLCVLVTGVLLLIVSSQLGLVPFQV